MVNVIMYWLLPVLFHRGRSRASCSVYNSRYRWGIVAVGESFGLSVIWLSEDHLRYRNAVSAVARYRGEVLLPRGKCCGSACCFFLLLCRCGRRSALRSCGRKCDEL